MIKFFSLIFLTAFVFSSCKTDQLLSFKPAVINKVEYNSTLSKNESFFKTHNKWIIEGIDSVSKINQTVKLDTLNKNSSGLLNFTLLFNLRSSLIKNIEYYRYEVNVVPLHKDIFEENKYLVFGFNSNQFNRIDSFNVYKSEFKWGFNTYFNLSWLSQITPWRYNLKCQNVKDNYISFSINNIEFSHTNFTRSQKKYFKRILNNCFVKVAKKNNMGINKDSKDRNDYFINFYNNKHKLFNTKTDYTIDFKFSESERKDSIVLDINCYSKRNKEINLLIPDILETHYTFDKHAFELGNHFDVNLKLNEIISIFLGNNKFIRYGAFE